MPPSWLETGELLDSIHALKAFGRYDEAEQLWVRHVPEVAEMENSARVLHRFESFLSSSPTPMRAVHLSLPLDSPRRLASHARPRVLPRKPGTGAGVTHRRVPVHAPFLPRPLLASLAAPDLFSASFANGTFPKGIMASPVGLCASRPRPNDSIQFLSYCCRAVVLPRPDGVRGRVGRRHAWRVPVMEWRVGAREVRPVVGVRQTPGACVRKVPVQMWGQFRRRRCPAPEQTRAMCQH